MRCETLEILQLCHLGICMYTMGTRKGLTEYPYTLHIEEVYEVRSKPRLRNFQRSGNNYLMVSNTRESSAFGALQKHAVPEGNRKQTGG